MRILRSGGWTAALLLLLASMAACTSDETDAGPAGETPTSTGPEISLTRPNAPLDVTIAQLGGGIKDGQRSAIVQAASKPLDTWISGAYLDGPYPTTDFAAGFDSWTPGAAKLGERDRDTTTNAAIGEQVVAVVADKQQARLFIFAVNGKAGGATAKVLVKLTAQRDDGSLAHIQVRGDVYLTRDGSTWEIFGYDLARTEGAA
jgi:hypothetical protein